MYINDPEALTTGILDIYGFEIFGVSLNPNPPKQFLGSLTLFHFFLRKTVSSSFASIS